MTSALEQIRALEEDTERLQHLAAEHLLKDVKSQRDRIAQQHIAKDILDRLQGTGARLVAAYEDAEGFKAAELRDIEGTDPTAFERFYDQLQQLRDYHRRFPDMIVQRPETVDDAIPPSIAFSGEESHGRYLDLHSFYHRYLNTTYFKTMPNVDARLESSSYKAYVSSFHLFSDGGVKDRQYVTYVTDVGDYLVDFLRRSQPLLNVEQTLATIGRETQEQWDSGVMRSWNKGDNEGESPGGPGVWCDACERWFSKASVYSGHLAGKKHKRAAFRAEGKAADVEEWKREVFFAEVRVHRLASQLSDVIDATVANVEKKLTRTLRERLMAIAEEERESDEESSEDDEEVVQGIKNYPLDVHGEPIPYWLYRLHGLGVEYKCEICGNTSYWGLRAFDRHFQDWRHAHGMKMLGIPNTDHFHNVVKMKDAIELYKKLQAEEAKSKWVPEDEEECEDADGVVYTKRVAEMMKAQGVWNE